MKKETAIISVIAVAVIAFMLGRLSVDTSPVTKPAQETAKEAATKAPSEAAPPAAVAPTTAPVPEERAATGLAALPSKGAENPKVAIVEVSEFQ